MRKVIFETGYIQFELAHLLHKTCKMMSTKTLYIKCATSRHKGTREAHNYHNVVLQNNIHLILPYKDPHYTMLHHTTFQI